VDENKKEYSVKHSWGIYLGKEVKMTVRNGKSYEGTFSQVKIRALEYLFVFMKDSEGVAVASPKFSPPEIVSVEELPKITE
jgi:hypothetical protein